MQFILNVDPPFRYKSEAMTTGFSIGSCEREEFTSYTAIYLLLDLHEICNNPFYVVKHHFLTLPGRFQKLCHAFALNAPNRCRI